MRRASTCRCPVRFLPLFIARYSPQRTFTGRCVKLAVAVSSLQGCCDGRRISPLETGVQPMQASPLSCVQDLRPLTLHPFAFSRFAGMLLSPSGFPSRLAGCPRRFFRPRPPAPVGQSHVRRNGAPQLSGWHHLSVLSCSTPYTTFGMASIGTPIY